MFTNGAVLELGRISLDPKESRKRGSLKECVAEFDNLQGLAM